MTQIRPSIRRATADDLPKIATAHVLSFSDRALSALGHEAVRRYYEWQLLGPHDSVSILAENAGEVTGFVVGGVFSGALSGFLQENRGFLVMCVIRRPWLLANPIISDRIGRALGIFKLPSPNRANQNHSNSPERQSPNAAEKLSFGILSIAVVPAFRGSGLAQQLMMEAEAVARSRGFGHMHLTVAVQNHRAIRFYEKLGWSRITDSGAWTGRMEKRF